MSDAVFGGKALVGGFFPRGSIPTVLSEASRPVPTGNRQSARWIPKSTCRLPASRDRARLLPPTRAAETVSEKLDMLGSARARFGYLPGPTYSSTAPVGQHEQRLEQSVIDVSSGGSISGSSSPTSGVRVGRWRRCGSEAAEQQLAATRRIPCTYDFGRSADASEFVTVVQTSGTPERQPKCHGRPFDRRRGSRRPKLQIRLNSHCPRKPEIIRRAADLHQRPLPIFLMNRKV